MSIGAKKGEGIHNEPSRSLWPLSGAGQNWFGFCQGTYGKAESEIIGGISGHTLADLGLKRLIFVAGVELVIGKLDNPQFGMDRPKNRKNADLSAQSLKLNVVIGQTRR